MTAKQKAKELFDKYWQLNTDFDGLIKYELAKQCALITVDEIIYLFEFSPPLRYWQEVKQEIESL